MAIQHRSIISLCAGYAGIDLGLQLAVPGARTVCYVEREITVARRLVARFEDGTLHPADIWSDLRTFDGRRYRGKIWAVTAGYPCQPFSCAGKQLGTKDPRHLWPEVARIIREVEPERVLLENVDAHLRLGFHEVAEELAGMGYRLACGLFTAAEVGAPHRRRRLFALADRSSGRRGELRQPSRGNGLIDRSGEAMEYSGSPERRPYIVGRGRGESRQDRQGKAASGTGKRGADLADSDTLRRENHREDTHEAQQHGSIESGSYLFPPGPEEYERWARLLAIRPDIEPSICRASYGGSSRVDRLRALGNGVVPLVAAHAYRTLNDALRTAG